jgi:transcriptional regulator with XRE-family HTH domain
MTARQKELRKAREKEQQKFGAHLRKIREAKGISIHELAAISELEYGQLQKTETGQVNPTLFTILRIAAALKISPSELLNY